MRFEGIERGVNHQQQNEHVGDERRKRQGIRLVWGTEPLIGSVCSNPVSGKGTLCFFPAMEIK